jgi:L-alanine-DL-glutamate epimerase-like enolase superfamily enzyme
VNEAIRVGKLLQEYNYGYFEEPVFFDWLDGTKQVADAPTARVLRRRRRNG